MDWSQYHWIPRRYCTYNVISMLFLWNCQYVCATDCFWNRTLKLQQIGVNWVKGYKLIQKVWTFTKYGTMLVKVQWFIERLQNVLNVLELNTMFLDTLWLTVKVNASWQGLALINGTQMITSLGAEAVERAQAIARQADIIAALTLEVLKGTTKAFDSGESHLRCQSAITWTMVAKAKLLHSCSYEVQQVCWTINNVITVSAIAISLVIYSNSVHSIEQVETLQVKHIS